MVLQLFNDGYFETKCKLLMAPVVANSKIKFDGCFKNHKIHKKFDP